MALKYHSKLGKKHKNRQNFNPLLDPYWTPIYLVSSFNKLIRKASRSISSSSVGCWWRPNCLKLYQGDPNQQAPFRALIGPFWALIGIWRGVAQGESKIQARKPNLATFGQIIYYISSRFLKNHSEESRKDLIT